MGSGIAGSGKGKKFIRMKANAVNRSQVTVVGADASTGARIPVKNYRPDDLMQSKRLFSAIHKITHVQLFFWRCDYSWIESCISLCF